MKKKIIFKTKSSIVFFLCFYLFLNSCNSSSTPTDPIPAPVPTPTNTKPVALDDVLSVNKNSTAGIANQITVSANDNIGKDGGTGNDYTITTNPTNGTVTKISNGVYEYVPKLGYTGTDTFVYTLKDKDGDSATATVTITIKNVLTKEDFANIDPSLPSFVSINNTTPTDKKWVKQENMSDEFSSWDSTKWFKSTWNYGVPVFMSTSNTNSGVADGNLWIKATLNESNPENRWFQAARIHSRTKISYPMYTEARIKSAHISAYNTYWLNNGNSTDRDEIDIIENNSKPSCGCQPNFPLQMNSQYFHADSAKTPVQIRNEDNFNQNNLSAVNPLKGVKWNEDYHTFGVWWKDAYNIQFYLDGELAGKVTVGQDRSGKTYTDRKFTRDLEIIFDLWTADETWLGGLASKSDLGDNTINTMKVDWVRTWKLENK